MCKIRSCVVCRRLSGDEVIFGVGGTREGLRGEGYCKGSRGQYQGLGKGKGVDHPPGSSVSNDVRQC